MGEKELRSTFLEEEVIQRLLAYAPSTLKKERHYAEKSKDRKRILGNEKIPPAVKRGRSWIYPKDEFISWCRKRGYDFLIPQGVRR